MAKLVLKPTTSSRQEISLDNRPLSIGRDSSNDLVLKDVRVSRRHAVIEWRGGRYYVRDRGSLNGSLVNGDRVTDSSLRDGDLVAIGAARLLFREGSRTRDSSASTVPHPSAPLPECPTCHADNLARDPFCRECGTRLAFPRGPAKIVCASCGTAVTLSARFCSGCGSTLTPGDEGLGSGPHTASGDLAPGASGPFTPVTQQRGAVGGRLTAQQASLVRAVVLNRDDYLHRSYYRDPATGQRTAYSLEEDEWSRFAAGWTVEPFACIRAINRAIAGLRTPARIRRYLEAAVELETLMDRRALRAPEGRVLSGIPGYIMDGYTDMGRNSSTTERRGREKICVDKERLKTWLVESRWRALAYEPQPEELLAGFYAEVRRSFRFDESRAKDLFLEWGDQSVNLSCFLDHGVGVCRHLSILYQLCLQEAAIPARVVKGSLRVFGIEQRHAWNLAWLMGRVALVDVTLPSREGPLIVMGSSREEVYRMANRGARRYVPTPDEQNHYKVGSPAD